MGEEKGLYQKEIMLKEWEKLDPVQCFWQSHAARKALEQHSRGTVGMRTESGVKFPGSEQDLSSASGLLSQFSHLWYGAMVIKDPASQNSHKD